MNRLIVYIFLVLVYITLAKSFSPSEYGISYVQNSQSLAKIIKGSPVTVILTDMHATGFLIKTYYHKYKVVYGYQSVEEIIVRTSSDFAAQHQKHVGLSIFRRYEKDNNENSTPIPPGSMFIGDKDFGRWKKDSTNNRIWRFYRVYRNLPTYLGWNEFKPDYEFYEKVNYHLNLGKVFYGMNDEFGSKGKITMINFPKFFQRKPRESNIKKYLYNYFRENFIEK